MSSVLLKQVVETACFPRFGQLPPEIRIKIWQYSMPNPRLVTVKSPFRTTPPPSSPPAPATSLVDVLASCYNSPAVPREDPQSWKSDTPPPALLHVNAEARHEALRHYTLSFGVGDSAPRIYVDFERDALFFGSAELEGRCNPLWAGTADLGLVRRLAIVPEAAWRVLRWWKGVELDSLREIVFVHGADELDSKGPLPALLEDAAVFVDDGGGGGDDNDVGSEIHEMLAECRGRACPEEERPVVSPLEISKKSKNPTVRTSTQQHCETLSTTAATDHCLGISSERPRPRPHPRRTSREMEPAALRRQQDARSELATLMAVLPDIWSKEPLVTTAVLQGPVAVAPA